MKKKSKYTGVSWDKKLNKWRSQISIEGRTRYLGVFSDEEKASKAYNRKSKEIKLNY